MGQFHVDLENSLDLLKIEKLYVCKLNSQLLSTLGRNRFSSGRVRVSLNNFRSDFYSPNASGYKGARIGWGNKWKRDQGKVKHFL